MFDTAQALAVAVIAVLPGAAFTFSYERGAGTYGVTRSDRLIRFLTASAVFHALLSGLTYHFYVRTIHSQDLQQGRVSPWAVELASVVYIAIPVAAGLLIGHGKSN